MRDEETDIRVVGLMISLVLITGRIVAGDSLETDREVLLSLKKFLEDNNQVNRGRYQEWNLSSWNPCDWPGILCSNDGRVISVNLSDNSISGEIFHNFSALTKLSHLDLSKNTLGGRIPADLRRCESLVYLNLSHNIINDELNLTGLKSLEVLDLSINRIGGEIQLTFPAGFARLQHLRILNLWGNHFTGPIPPELGSLSSLEGLFLVLHTNSYTGGPLPVELSEMPSLEFLILAHNQFSGSIPPEFGNIRRLQALDLSFNSLNGSIPSTIGKLNSLLWLMLANNRFSGEIPPEIGNCTSLLWLNLANNQFSGKIPPELTTIGRNPFPTFEMNRKNRGIPAGSGECQVRTLQISGYVQISGNQFSGEVPPEIRNMQNFSLIQMAANKFYGKLPPAIGQLPVVVLNLSENNFSGEIPMEIGNLGCLQNLDLSSNNFSGTFPTSLNNLSELNKFNISYNPLISGVIPSTGQLATFEKESFLGDPLLVLPPFIGNPSNHPPPTAKSDGKPKQKFTSAFVFLTLTVAFIIHDFASTFTYADILMATWMALKGKRSSGLKWRRRLDVAIDVARALVFLHHECFTAIVHRDVKASNVLLDRNGKARVTDFGLARVVDDGNSHVSTMVAGTVGYVAPEYGQTGQATTKGDVYSFGVLSMELATGRHALDGGEECLGAEEMRELLRIGIKCTAESPQARPNMKEVLAMLITILSTQQDFSYGSSPPSSEIRIYSILITNSVQFC
ncbi:unnamed protein product, partial [Vitis vinifera]